MQASCKHRHHYDGKNAGDPYKNLKTGSSDPGAGVAKRKYGRIVNITSGGAYLSAHAYGVSKLALQGLTSWLATELGPSGVTVNAIAPGALNTAQGDKARPPQFVEMLRSVTPLKPLGEPQDLIGALLLLVSQASSWITGEIIRVDGGWIKSVL